MNDKEKIRLSRFLSLVLRHKPQEIGITLDENGWADITALIDGVRSSGRNLTLDLLCEIVAEDEKQRYIFSEDGRRIRASQGHSISVDLELRPVEPPEFLYHGTASRFSVQIQRKGLKPQCRQFVHLSSDMETAVSVGARHGIPIIFQVHAQKMWQNGIAFYLSENKVWLTEHVPAQYLELLQAGIADKQV